MSEFTPTENDMLWQYVVRRMHDGVTRTHAEQEYRRWLTAHDARILGIHPDVTARDALTA